MNPHKFNNSAYILVKMAISFILQNLFLTRNYASHLFTLLVQFLEGIPDLCFDLFELPAQFLN